MGKFVARRILYMIPTLIFISIAAFAIIQLPPGDYLTTLKSQLEAQGQTVDQGQLAALDRRYGLSEPFYLQYLHWIGRILLHGDFGQSFEWNRPVTALLAQRLPLTVTIASGTLLFTWIVAFPIGIYTAVRKYSVGDYTMTFVGFLGLAVPNFLLALIFSYLGLEYFGQSVGGLFSPEYLDASWNVGKILDLLRHLIVPIVVLGAAGTAGIIRILRANLIDELHKPYVSAARSRGLSERRLLFTYPTRVALNPFVSTVGWVLPHLVGGEIIVSQVLGLDTTGPLLLRALQSQDMYLAGSLILILSTLTVIGTLLSDILLAVIDPRIRYRYS